MSQIYLKVLALCLPNLNAKKENIVAKAEHFLL